MSLAVGLLLAAAVSSAPTAPKVKWEKSFTAARLRAKAEAKPIMICLLYTSPSPRDS